MIELKSPAGTTVQVDEELAATLEATGYTPAAEKAKGSRPAAKKTTTKAS